MFFMETEGEQIARKLTDDRINPDLLVFEKTWGHRLLAGVSVSMLAIGCVIVLLCVMMIMGLLGSGSPGVLGNFIAMLFAIGAVLGFALVPPAILGIHVAKHPQRANIAIAAAAIAFVLIVSYVVFSLTATAWQPFSVGMYALVASALPLVYLVAAIKVKRS